MNKLTFSLLFGVGLFASGAEAGPLTKGISQVDNGPLRVRMLCDQPGNCREEHHDQPVVIRTVPMSHGASTTRNVLHNTDSLGSVFKSRE